MYVHIYVYIHIHTSRQIQRHTVLELDKYWWICGSEMENADSLMKCYDCKRGREQRLVPSPVAAQGNAGRTAFHGSPTWWIRFQSESEAIPYLLSGLLFSFPSVSVMLKYLYSIKSVPLGSSDNVLVLKTFWKWDLIYSQCLSYIYVRHIIL